MSKQSIKHEVNKGSKDPITPENIESYTLIQNKVEKLQYGQTTVTLRIHNGRITDIMFQDFERVRIKKKD